jgi:methionine synthase II (cobalamin-independent)
MHDMGKLIDEKTTIEELVEAVPASVAYLSRKGIKCIACGEPVWGTLEEAAMDKGFGEEEIRGFVADLNDLAGT